MKISVRITTEAKKERKKFPSSTM